MSKLFKFPPDLVSFESAPLVSDIPGIHLQLLWNRRSTGGKWVGGSEESDEVVKDMPWSIEV